MPALDARATILCLTTAAMLLPLQSSVCQLSIPVSATVKAGGNPPAVQQIGTISVSTTGHAISGMFALAPAFAYLDLWYDFKWVNVETGYTVNGVAQTTDPVVGMLPAIDPQPLAHTPPGDDNLPYYFTGAEWRNGTFAGTTIHNEGVSSTFVDARHDNPPCGMPPCSSSITFNTFLVADDITAMAIPDNQFCVLAGYSWTYTRTITALSDTETAATGAAIGAAAGATTVNSALGNASPAFPPPGGTGTNAWSAISGCTLIECDALFLDALPSQGVPEGWAVTTRYKGTGAASFAGGLTYVHPTGAAAPISVTGLSIGLTGVGAAPTSEAGAFSCALMGSSAGLVYVGEVTSSLAGPAFATLDLHRVVLNGSAATSDTVIATVPTLPTTSSQHIVAVSRVGATADAVIATDVPGFPLGYYAAGAATLTPVAVAGLPPGTPTAAAVDPTVSSIYLALSPIPAVGIIVSVPITGGAAIVLGTLPAAPTAIDVHPRSGVLYVSCAGGPPNLFSLDPFTGATNPILANTGALNGVVVEEATGQLLASGSLTSNPPFAIFRVPLTGNASVIATQSPSSPWGVTSRLDLNPDPARYGIPSVGEYSVQWNAPWVGATSPLGGLPTSGNAGFGLSISSGGTALSGLVAVATAPSSPPGIPVLDGLVHLDVSTVFWIISVQGSPSVALPLPLPVGFAGARVYLQAVFGDAAGFVWSQGIRVTIL